MKQKQKTEQPSGKVIPNKTTLIEVRTDTGVELLRYSNLVTSVLKNIRPEGFSIEEMRKCFRICDIAEAANGEIVLSEEDFAYFKTKISGMRWAVLHKDIVQFEDDINAIK